MPCQFQQQQGGYPVAVMGADVAVLCFAHLHFVLQHLGHGSDAFAIALHGDCIYIFGKQVVVFLLFEVALVVHQVVGGVQVLGLQAFAGIFLRQLYVLDIYGGLPGFVTLVQPVKYRNAQ